jgi:hypothetical protein
LFTNLIFYTNFQHSNSNLNLPTNSQPPSLSNSLTISQPIPSLHINHLPITNSRTAKMAPSTYGTILRHSSSAGGYHTDDEGWTILSWYGVIHNLR